MLCIDSGLDLSFATQAVGLLFRPVESSHYFASTLFVVATLILAGLYALGEFLQNKNLNPILAALITLGIGWVSHD